MSKKYVGIGLLCLLGLGLVFFLRQSGSTSLFSGEELKNFVESFGLWAPLVYLSLYVIATLLFIPGSPITLASGVLFGPWYGTLYTVVGATIGACLAFLLSRTLGHGLIKPGTGKIAEKLQTYDERIARHGFLTVLLLRLVPLFPFNGLNFALGFTNVSFRDYFLGTLIGIIPGTFAYVYFGSALVTLDLVTIVGAIVLIGALTLLGKYIIKMKL